MALIRVPYPKDPERRNELFARATLLLSRFGAHEGTVESGVFHGSTPVGAFAGTYRLLEGSGELEIHLAKKPWVITTSFIEAQIRKHLAAEMGSHEGGTGSADSPS